MHFKTVLMLSLMVLLFASCVQPVVSDSQEYADECKMLTKKLDLKTSDLPAVNCSDPRACLLYAVTVPIGSFVLSSSIVLVGNTLHWIEYQGTCDEGIVSQSVDKFKTLLGFND